MVIRGLTVLLIEDSEPEQELIKEYFEISNLGQFSVLTADRLVEAIQILQEKSVDIIVLDLGLPDSNGIETLVAVLSVSKGCPVIVLTGNDDKVLGEEAINRGAQDFLAKGMGAEALLPRICYYTLQRHHLQKKVQEAETFLRNTIDSLTENIAIIDIRGTIQLVNKRWSDFAAKVGLAEGKSGVGFNYFEMCVDIYRENKELLDTFTQKTNQVIAGQIPFFDIEYPCPNQQNEVWYHVRVSPFIGIGKGCLVIAHNEITEKKRIETALKRNEAYLQLIFDTTPDCVFVKDDQGRYVMANRAIGNLYGVEVSDMLGKTDEDLLTGDEARKDVAYRYMADDDYVLRSGFTRHRDEEAFTNQDGETRWFRTVTTPINFPDLPRYLLGIASEITSERADKEKIKDSELLLRTILDAMHYNIVLLDTDLKVVWSNKAAEDSMKEKKTIVGERCLHLNMIGEGCSRCNAKQALEAGEKTTGTYKLANNTSWRITGCPIINERKEIHNVLCIAEDISKWISLEQQLRQAQKMEALGTLAGGIAHDFNNILTAILGFTELSIEKTRLGSSMAELSHDLQEVYRASVRAKDLVHQILTFSRKIDCETQPLDMALIIKEALKLLRSTLPSSIRLTSRVPVNLGHVVADPIHIHQIIMNLCTNASHAISEDTGEISVILSSIELVEGRMDEFLHLAPGNYLLLEVKDTGCGISQENLHTIFEPYFTTKDQGEGTGLGLAVVHGIVNELGGEIHVQSEIGDGTRFSLYFPVENKAGTIENNKREWKDVEAGKGERILLVDDEPMILDLCRFMLSSAGYIVDITSDPRTVIPRINENGSPYALVITDITMPYLAGDKLSQDIHAVYPELPVILMSGKPKEIENLSRFEKENKVLKKPFTKRQLLQIVWDTLNDSGGNERESMANTR